MLDTHFFEILENPGEILDTHFFVNFFSLNPCVRH